LNKVLITAIPLCGLIAYTPNILKALRGEDTVRKSAILLDALCFLGSFSHAGVHFYLYKKFRWEKYQSRKDTVKQIMKMLEKTQALDNSVQNI
jgi:hypothetical protein